MGTNGGTPAPSTDGRPQAGNSYTEGRTSTTAEEAASDTDFAALAVASDDDNGDGPGGLEAPDYEKEQRESTERPVDDQLDKTREKQKEVEPETVKQHPEAGVDAKAKEGDQKPTTEKPQSDAQPLASPEAAPEQKTEAQPFDYDKWFNEQAVPEVAKNYELSDEEYAEFEADPRIALPKLAAKVSIRTTEMVAQQLQAQMPNMITAYLIQYEQASKDTQDFYAAWPALKDPKYTETVARAGQLYRMSNPKASKEQFIREVGAHVMFAERLVPSDQSREATTSDARPVRQPTGQAPITPAKSGPDNEFEELSTADFD